MIRFVFFALCLPALAACETFGPDTRTPDIVLDDEAFVEAVYLDETGLDEAVVAAPATYEPVTLPGQLMPIPPAEDE
ncbi:MAG: hypothetical protein AAF074_18880, partial [Pseudomonadota bacterium]